MALAKNCAIAAGALWCHFGTLRKVNKQETRVIALSVSVHLYDPSIQEHRDSQTVQREITATIVQTFVWFTVIYSLVPMAFFTVEMHYDNSWL